MKPLKRILIIDDYEFIQIVIDAVLESSELYTYECIHYIDPIEAIKIFQKEKFDFVITDYEMPDMKGDEVFNNIKKINPNIKIMVMSAWFDSHNAPKGTILHEIQQKTTADAYMPKPFTDDFTQIVDRLCT
jgi:CheY-like chemotaxis protein